MFSRQALRSLFSAERVANQQPLFSYASRAYLHQASTSSGSQNFQATLTEVPPASSSSSVSQTSTSPTTDAATQLSTTPFIRNKLPLPPRFDSNLKITQSLADKLPYLYTQRPHYISAHLHDRPYLLTEGDQLRLPFLMPKVKSGDIIRFNRASVVGSRDYTLKGSPYIDERMYECRLRVLGIESEPLRIKEKTKRRRRHVQRIKSKHRYTILRVMEVKVKSLEELVEEGAEVLQEGVIHEEAVDVIEKKSHDATTPVE
ncbi:uncharacterized protein BHQ10_008311 [Talaromyces amestolkiae]|uniref:Large ribosomal subunit protein bL21m n=1 Tax=Talaromyces amestolkiae TaxID=1196081 RepID=A0A364L943_TALAM|nr:uncharacterized protein BHQ10_008311 [Talaromyces amestolkiae]RAO72299.1 hypothetical protein BHQ10_008311 [Talaromyces amestolkiae]